MKVTAAQVIYIHLAPILHITPSIGHFLYSGNQNQPCFSLQTTLTIYIPFLSRTARPSLSHLLCSSLSNSVMNRISVETTRVLHTSMLESQWDTKAATCRMCAKAAGLLYCMRNGLLTQGCTETLSGETNEQESLFSIERCKTYIAFWWSLLLHCNSIHNHKTFHARIPIHLPASFHRQSPWDPWWPPFRWRLYVGQPDSAARCYTLCKSLHASEHSTL